MNSTQVQWLLGTSWAAVIIVLATTTVVIVLGLVAFVRRTPYASRVGRIVLSSLVCVGFFLPATLLFEKMESGSVGFRVHIGEPAFGWTWDLLITIGAAWIAFWIGWFAARILQARTPMGWSGPGARTRDLGLLALFASAVFITFANGSPSILGTSPLGIDVPPLGIWALAEAIPLSRMVWRRSRAEGESEHADDRVDRFGRALLARYYWLVALAVPFALWGLSTVEQELQG